MLHVAAPPSCYSSFPFIQIPSSSFPRTKNASALFFTSIFRRLGRLLSLFLHSHSPVCLFVALLLFFFFLRMSCASFCLFRGSITVTADQLLAVTSLINNKIGLVLHVILGHQKARRSFRERDIDIERERERESFIPRESERQLSRERERERNGRCIVMSFFFSMKKHFEYPLWIGLLGPCEVNMNAIFMICVSSLSRFSPHGGEKHVEPGKLGWWKPCWASMADPAQKSWQSPFICCFSLPAHFCCFPIRHTHTQKNYTLIEQLCGNCLCGPGNHTIPFLCVNKEGERRQTGGTGADGRLHSKISWKQIYLQQVKS